MSLFEEIKRVIDIKDKEEKSWEIDNWVYRFEVSHSLNYDELAQALPLLLTSALDEKDDGLRLNMFDAIQTAVGYQDIGARVDWDVLMPHLPDLNKDDLIFALDILGFSQQEKYLPNLEEYRNHEDLYVQLAGTDAYWQLKWDLSGHDPAIKAQAKDASDEIMRKLRGDD